MMTASMNGINLGMNFTAAMSAGAIYPQNLMNTKPSWIIMVTGLTKDLTGMSGSHESTTKHGALIGMDVGSGIR